MSEITIGGGDLYEQSDANEPIQTDGSGIAGPLHSMVL